MAFERARRMIGDGAVARAADRLPVRPRRVHRGGARGRVSYAVLSVAGDAVASALGVVLWALRR
jgi:hypothetical protein